MPGIDLFGSAEGYRPGQPFYRMDGVPVSQSQFMLEVNSGRIGGAFGLLFMSARMSTQVIGQRDKGVSWGTPFTATYGVDGSRSINWGTHNPALSGVNFSNTTVLYNQNWTMLTSIIPMLDDNQKALDQAIQDVKDIFNGDNDCSKFFEQAIKIASVRSTENGIETSEDIYKRYDATPAAEDLGNQLRGNIGFLGANKSNNTTIGIEMTHGKKDRTIQNGDGFTYNMFDKAVVNIRGPFVRGTSFGSYSGRAGRALAILHEIAHLVQTGFAKDGTRTHLIEDDGDSDKKDKNGKSKSEQNTDIVEGKCKKELDKLK